MILMYHKVAPNSPSKWWVEADAFYRQMCELAAYEVVYLDDYDPHNQKQAVITFDGVYDNVLSCAAPILKRFGYPFELFVTSGYLGRENDFDAPEPSARFADADELKELLMTGGRLQWHTRTHPVLTGLTDENLASELTVPTELKAMDPHGLRWLAYPHGRFDERVIAAAEKSFAGALACDEGDDESRFMLTRRTIVNGTSFARASIGIVIPCYNYGTYLSEAVESALRQTRPATRILIADDCSSDNTPEISQYYQEAFPSRVSGIRHKQNLGIVRNFNAAVSEIGTDYVCFLGADNRFRSDYLERTSSVLDRKPETAIAYTDFALFGPRAKIDFDLFDSESRGPVLLNTYFIVRFPDFESVSPEVLRKKNIMHGSSMFRRRAFEQVGGYLEAGEAEDHNLFRRMVEAGWKARRVPFPLLEYRKHSSDQSNARFVTMSELNFYKELVRHKDKQIRTLKEELLQKRPLRSAAFWLALVPLRVFARLLPVGLKQRGKARMRSFLVACEKCDNPVFRLRRYVPAGLRKWVGTVIWRIQRLYFP